jgi:hypothetical protein
MRRAATVIERPSMSAKPYKSVSRNPNTDASPSRLP